MNKQKGIAQILVLIGMLVLAVALPLITKLVSINQENRSRAWGLVANCVYDGKTYTSGKYFCSGSRLKYCSDGQVSQIRDCLSSNKSCLNGACVNTLLWKKNSCNVTNGKYSCTSGHDSSYTFSSKASCENAGGCNALPGCPSGWPVSGYITQGPVSTPRGGNHPSEQIDITYGDKSTGRDIKSTHNGQIVFNGSDGNCGYAVTVQSTCNGNQLKTVYCHLKKGSSSHLRVGMQVKAGDKLGIMGDSGGATGIHLHYFLRGLGKITDYVPSTEQNIRGWRKTLDGTIPVTSKY